MFYVLNISLLCFIFFIFWKKVAELYINKYDSFLYSTALNSKI